MKKLSIILFCLSAFVCAKAQYPIQQSVGNAPNTIVKSNSLKVGDGFVNGVFADTTAANTKQIKAYPGAQILTYKLSVSDSGTLWIRNGSATKWLRGSGSIDITSFTFDNDTTGIICFSNGVCDTFSIVNLTNTVNNIVQNFLDSSITQINDSTLIICRGEGAARVCDTVHLGNTNTYYFLSPDSLVTCDTVQIICPIPDSCYQQQLCDTIVLSQPIVAPVYQNLVRQLPNNSPIREGGNDADGNGMANMIHDTYYNTSYYQFLIAGNRPGGPTLNVQQKQWSQLSASMMALNHLGAYRPDINFHQNNGVNLYFNYFDPFVVPTQGALTGDTVGFMGSRYGYALMTNAQGSQQFFILNDVTAKQSGIFFDTYSPNNEAVSIFGNQVPSAYGFTTNPPTDSTLVSARIAIFNTNKSINFPGYGVGTFTAGTPTYLIAVDANHNLMEYPPGGISGGLLSTADDGLTTNTPTNVRLFGTIGTPATLLDDRYLDAGAFSLNVNGDLAGTSLYVGNVNASGVGITGAALDGTGVFGSSAGAGTGVSGQSGTGIGVLGSGIFGVYGSTPNGRALSGVTTNGASAGLALRAEVTFNTTNATTPIAQFVRTISSGTPAAGFGGSLDLMSQTTSSTRLSNQLIWDWTTPTDASRVSRFRITGVNNAVTADLFTLSGSGSTRLNKYGINTFAGTPTFAAGWDANGNFVEFAVPQATMTADNGLTKNTSTNIQLGGPIGSPSSLLQSRYIATGSFTLNIQTATGGSTPLAVQSTSGIAFAATGTGAGSGIYTESGSGFGIEAVTFDGVAANLIVNPASTNTVIPVLQLNRRTSGAAANGEGGSIDFIHETDDFLANIANQVISKWTDVTLATRTSQLLFTGVTSATTQTWLTIGQSGYVKFRPMTVTEAGAIATAEGLMVFVSNTDATFVSVGLWIYQNGAWKAL